MEIILGNGCPGCLLSLAAAGMNTFLRDISPNSTYFMPNKLRIGVYGRAGQENVHRTLSGVLRYCKEAGGLTVHDFRTPEVIAKLMEDSRNKPPWEGRIDGVVLSTGRGEVMSDRQVADWMLRGGVPAVSVANHWLDPRIPVFHSSPAALGRLAAEHLTQCGCATYLYVGYKNSIGSARHGEAVRAALAKSGDALVQYTTSYRYIGYLEEESVARGEKSLAEHLRTMRKPIGVCALNDNFARAVCTLCEALNIKIPEQVKVLGAGDLSIARVRRPAMSSIRTPDEDIGYLAMRALHKMLNGQSGTRNVIQGVRKVTQVAATELVARATTIGAPRPNNDVDVALQYIARHACARLTVLQVAHAMGITPRWLGKMFQQAVGRSPGQEIQRVRLETAQDLLEKSHISISRIASMVGFEETAAFSKFFTKQTGISPLAYRQGHG